MARFRLELLGSFRAHGQDGSPVRFPTRKTEALLAFLALPPRRSRSRDELAHLLWGDSSDSLARKSLRQTLFLLRRMAIHGGGPRLIEEAASVRLDSADVDVDADDFEGCVREGTRASLARAGSLYRDDLLMGISVSTPAFEEWLMHERARYRERAIEAIATTLRDHCATGSRDEAIQSALRLLTIDSLQESVYRTLMRLYVESGRRALALRSYEACAALLRRELGVEPEEETRALYRQIVRRTVPTAPARPPGARAGGPGQPAALPADTNSGIARTVAPL